jgi:undecaprenyl-diphosphatase
VKKIILHSKILLLLTAEIITGVISSLVMAVLFFKIFQEILEQDTLYLDREIANFIYVWRTPWLTQVMILITNLGAEYMIAIAIIIVIFFVWKKHKREALTFTIILIMGAIINLSLKQLIHRPRPVIAPLIVESSSSFPSGHAMNAAVFYLSVSFYFYHFTRKKKLSSAVTVVSIILILLIGFSRIYLGVHYPSDVVAGYVVGTWWLVLAILISKSVSWFKIFKAEEKKAVY